MTEAQKSSTRKKKTNQKLPLRKTKKQLDNYVKYSSMALEMGVIIFLGVFGGLKLDQKLNLSFPFFTLLLSIVSVSLAIYVAIKDFLK